MKRSDNTTPHVKGQTAAAVLLWLLPVILVIPNVVLNFTEISYTGLDKLINVVLPMGCYLVLCSLSGKIGRTGLFFIPLMFLCAFQIVLLLLYGESIIAIDMFLNLATTNSNEVSEVLDNLGGAIALVCLLYLPVIGYSVYLTVCRYRSSAESRKYSMFVGVVLALCGAVCLVFVHFDDEGYKADRKLFPVNVMSNFFQAIHRSRLTVEYPETSADFSFEASDSRAGSQPEIYVMIIGETSRAGNWQLNGYDRPTNPRLSERANLFSFGKVLSESNTTHKSVPLMMSHLSSAHFSDSIYRTKGIIEAFAEAGYSTGWFSSQKRNHSLIDFFGEEADESVFITDDGEAHYDIELCSCLDNFLNRHNGRKCFVVLHTYGSHFNYKERFGEEYDYFRSDGPCTASKNNREHLVNAYDNSLRAVDAMIDSVIAIVDARAVAAAVVYAADHGEDIFDDSRERFLHASPTPTYYQLHVPMLVWFSDTYRDKYPDKCGAVAANVDKNISTSRSMSHTLLSLAGVESPVYDAEAAVSEQCYTEPVRQYLNDYNEAVPLIKSGLRKQDFNAFDRRKIAYK